ncbi:hypothetical protein KI387_040550, partial [Taxus chinensis]
GHEGHLGANRLKGRQEVCRAKGHPGRKDAEDAESRFDRRTKENRLTALGHLGQEDAKDAKIRQAREPTKS